YAVAGPRSRGGRPDRHLLPGAEESVGLEGGCPAASAAQGARGPTLSTPWLLVSLPHDQQLALGVAPIAGLPIARRFLSPLFVAGLVVLLVGFGILGLRALGLFEVVDLAAYDWYMRLRPGDPPADSRIVLITITERDIQNQGKWPLADGVLARVLEIIGRG